MVHLVIMIITFDCLLPTETVKQCLLSYHVHDGSVPLVTVVDDVAGVEVHHHHPAVLFHLVFDQLRWTDEGEI